MPYRFFVRVFISLFLLLSLSPVMAAPYVIKKWSYTTPSKQATYRYSYPEIPGSAAVNAKLKAAFMPTAAHIKDIEQWIAEVKKYRKARDSYVEEITGEVKLLTERMISVHYLGLGMLSGAAHPTKIIGSLNLDLKTGRVLALKDVLKPGSLPLVKAEAINALVPILKNHDLPEIRNAQDFRFYLTPHKLVLINLFESHAVASVEAEIPRENLQGRLLY